MPNEDLFDAPKRRHEDGFTQGEGELVNDDNYSGPQMKPGYYGGHDYDIEKGRVVPGSDGAGKAADRFRTMGGRVLPKTQIDQTDANQARGLQLGALAHLENAAAGRAPSQAANLAQLQTSQALGAQMGAAAGARGVGGQIAAMRGATAGAGQQMLAQNQGLMDMRAKEAGVDRSAFATGATGVRGQDIGVATADAEIEAKRRAMQEQMQQYYEKMGLNVDQAAQNAALTRRQQWDQARHAERLARDAEQAETVNRAVGYGSAGLTLGMGGIEAPETSDERAKQSIIPMGSLARYERR